MAVLSRPIFEDLPAEIRLKVYHLLIKSASRRNYNGLRLANRMIKAEFDTEYDKQLISDLIDVEVALTTGHFSGTFTMPTIPSEMHHLDLALQFLPTCLEELRPNKEHGILMGEQVRRITSSLVTLDIHSVTTTLSIDAWTEHLKEHWGKCLDHLWFRNVKGILLGDKGDDEFKVNRFTIPWTTAEYEKAKEEEWKNFYAMEIPFWNEEFCEKDGKHWVVFTKKERN